MKEKIVSGQSGQLSKRRAGRLPHRELLPAFAAFSLTALLLFVASRNNSDNSTSQPAEKVVATVDPATPAAVPVRDEIHQSIRHGAATVAANPVPETEVAAKTFHLRLGWVKAGALDGELQFGFVDADALTIASTTTSTGSVSGRFGTSGVIAPIGSGNSLQFAPVSGGALVPLAPFATTNGAGWTGQGGNTNWSNSGNWVGTQPSTDERDLYFGNAWRDAGATGLTTANNDLSYTGWHITFQDNGFGNPAASFTLTGTGISLLDFGGVAPGILNNSGLDQNINLNLTFKSTVGSAFLTDNNGNLNFGGTVTLDSVNGAFQFNLQGNSGPTINFNGAVANGGMRIAQTGNENVIFTAGLSGAGDYLKQGTGTVTFKTTPTTFGGGANNVFIDQGTVAVGTGGSVGTTNGTTTGLINMGSSGTAGLNTNVNLANSGITLANPILVRYLQTGGKTLSGTFGSGSSTFSGAISLADHLTIAAADGGTLLFTGVISQAAGTGSNTPGAGLVNNTSPSGGFSTNGPGVIINSGAASTGIVEYDNAMTYNGDTVVNSGTLQFNGSGSLANSTIRLGNLGPATLNLISPTGSTLNVTVNVRPSTGTKTISASNTSGTSTLGGHFALDDNALVTEASATGTLAITQAHSDGATAKTGTDIKGFTLTLTPTGTINISGDIYNSVNNGTVLMNGSGTLTLSGVNTYSGATNLSSGTLNINSTTALGATAATFTINGGTINNSSIGALTLANNNQQVWNSGFAFTGSQSLNMGTGAVSLGTTAGTSRTINVGGNTLTEGGVISNGTTANSLIKNGAGTLALNGANLFTGGVTINAGTVQAGSTTALGPAASATLTFGSGSTGKFQLNGKNTTVVGLNTNATIGTPIIEDNNATGATLTDNTTGSDIYAGVLQNGAAGTLGLTKSGTGSLALSGNNTFTGGLTLSGGTLTGTGANSLGAGVILINAPSPGSTLNLRADADTNFTNNGLTLNSSVGGTTTVSADQATGAGTNHILTLGGALQIANGKTLTITTGNGYTVGFGATNMTGATSGAASATFAGAGNAILASLTGSTNAATTSTANFNGSGTTTITGNVNDNTGALSLSKGVAAGTLILQGTNCNYTGATTISNGTIRTAVATKGFGNTTGIGIGGSGILDLRNDSSVAFSNGTTNYAVSTSSSGATINVDNNNSAVTNQTLTIGTLTIGGNHQLNITGGNDGYTLATGAVTANGNATFAPTGASANLASITGTNRNIALSGTATGNTVGAIATGSGTLSKNNTGTWTLTASNSFTGATTINAGTLIAGATGSLGSTASVVVNSSGTLALSGSGNLNRVNDAAPITLGTASGTAGTLLRSGAGTVSEGAGASRNGGTVTGMSSVGLGALTLASSSTLDFGTVGVGTFTFASFTPAGFTLNILNYTSNANQLTNVSGVDGTDDRLIFNQDQSANLAFFNFNGTAASEIALDGGFFEVVAAVPEPSTWVIGALALGTIFATQRRRLSRLRSHSA